MPSGYPKDPAATLAKRRATNARALAADEKRIANGGPLIKRKTKTLTLSAAEILKSNKALKDLREKLAGDSNIDYGRNVSSTKKVSVHKPSADELMFAKDIAELILKIKDLQDQVSAADGELLFLVERNQELIRELTESEERRRTLTHRLMTVIDLVANQK